MENIVILISFVGLCVLYFVYLHKKLMQKLENKIEAAKHNLINSNNLIKEYEVKIAELEGNLLKLDENFKLTCSEIEVEIECAMMGIIRGLTLPYSIVAIMRSHL